MGLKDCNKVLLSVLALWHDTEGGHFSSGEKLPSFAIHKDTIHKSVHGWEGVGMTMRWEGGRKGERISHESLGREPRRDQGASAPWCLSSD